MYLQKCGMYISNKIKLLNVFLYSTKVGDLCVIFIEGYTSDTNMWVLLNRLIADVPETILDSVSENHKHSI